MNQRTLRYAGAASIACSLLLAGPLHAMQKELLEQYHQRLTKAYPGITIIYNETRGAYYATVTKDHGVRCRLQSMTGYLRNEDDIELLSQRELDEIDEKFATEVEYEGPRQGQLFFRKYKDQTNIRTLLAISRDEDIYLCRGTKEKASIVHLDDAIDPKKWKDDTPRPDAEVAATWAEGSVGMQNTKDHLGDGHIINEYGTRKSVPYGYSGGCALLCGKIKGKYLNGGDPGDFGWVMFVGAPVHAGEVPKDDPNKEGIIYKDLKNCR